MPVPSKMQDLPTLAASNSPAGSDAIGNSLDDYIRAISAIIRSTNANSSASIAAASTVDLGSSDGEAVTVTGTATITSFGTVVSGLRRVVTFAAAGVIITNSASIALLPAANITTNAGDKIVFRSLGSGNWAQEGPRFPIALADIPALATTYLPLAGGTLTGAVTTPNIAQSLIVQQGSSGVIANATGGLAGLIVRGVGTGNAAFLEFLRDTFGSYLGLDTDNVLKYGGANVGAVSYRVVHEGITNVSLPGTLVAATSISSPAITSTTSGVISQGAGAGFSFADRTNGAQSFSWFASANQANLFSSASGNLITTNITTGNTTVAGTWTGPNFIATSDRRKKKFIKKRKARQDLADRLEFVSFSWKKDNRPDLGVIADHVKEVAPEYVYEDREGFLGIDKAMLALEAVIGLAARVRALEAKA